MIVKHVFTSRFLAFAGFCLACLFAHNSYAGGQVIAWGYNLYGQCDVPAEALSRVTSIAGGEAHSLALKDGKVIAWGANDYGQCDVPAEALSGVSAIAGGEAYSLALKDGKVIAWGKNDRGQCDVPAEALSNVSAIAGGLLQSLALKDGQVIAWGVSNDVPAEALSGASAIACGWTHDLVLKDGKVIAWGYNDYGQCNVPAEALSGVSAIAAGGYYSLALKDGKVIAWGYNLNGQGDVPILGLSGVIAIAGGVWHILALREKSLKVYNDFDGDGRTDPAIYYPASGNWSIFQTSTFTIRTEQLGFGACRPTPCDYDGDGKTDIVVFDPTTANWYGKLSGGGEGMATFGWPGTWPVPGDYDGDRKADIAVYDPQTGIWTAFLSTRQVTGDIKWGYLGDFRSWENPQTYTVLPMPFDYNQDGVDDLAVYYRGWSMDDSVWTILYLGVSNAYYTWGSSGSLPVPGNYQVKMAEAPQGVCVYKISSTEWAIPYRSAFYMGVYGETLPVPAGDYDGNGYDDNAVYNYVTGLWTVVLNTGGANVLDRTVVWLQFGGPDAVPANIYSTIYALGLYSPEPW